MHILLIKLKKTNILEPSACVFPHGHDLWLEWGIFFILVTLHLCLLLIHRYLWNSQKWQILTSVNSDLDFFYFLRFVTRTLPPFFIYIFRHAKEIYFNEKFPILWLFTLCKIEINLKYNSNNLFYPAISTFAVEICYTNKF